MPSTIGKFSWDSENKFTVTFDKVHKAFTANEAPGIQRLVADGERNDTGMIASTLPQIEPITVYATLNYTNMDQLTSKRAYAGMIGTVTYTINLDNGVVIEGLANQPGISPAIGITGSGIWEDI